MLCKETLILSANSYMRGASGSKKTDYHGEDGRYMSLCKSKKCYETNVIRTLSTKEKVPRMLVIIDGDFGRAGTIYSVSG